MKTRNGTPFRIYATDGLPSHSIHGAVFIDGGWIAYEWTPDGFVNDDGSRHELDLPIWATVQVRTANFSFGVN